jgi:HEAT repeat protein
MDVEALIQAALTDVDAAGAARWRAITVLQRLADMDTFKAARRLCASAVAEERVLGADILGEIGRDRPFADRTLAVLRFLAASETEPRVLYSVLIALGLLRDPRALQAVIELSRHEDASVRYGAAYALPNLLGEPPDAVGMAALCRLADDEDGDVADWATLGLALTSGGKIEYFGGQVLDP